MAILIRLNDQDRADALASILETIVAPGAEGDDAILVENIVAQLRGFVPPGDQRKPLSFDRPEPGPMTLDEQFERSRLRSERWAARLKEPLTEEDLNTCPSCGASGDHWLREIGKRHTWQPLGLELADEGDLVPGDYDSFDYGDDVEVDYFECSSCTDQWPTMERLHHALVSAKHARADASWLEQMLVDETTNALAVLVCDSSIRLHLETNDPQALEQAREALGLPVQHTTKEGPNA